MYYAPIVHHSELWAKIEHIRIWEEMLDELRTRQARHFDSDTAYAIQKLNEKIVNIKRSVRKFLRQERETEGAHVVHRDFDYCIWLIPLPVTITDAETAEEWFQDNEYMPIRYSAYDCTGQHFTSWYRIVNRNGRFWAYHCESIDV